MLRNYLKIALRTLWKQKGVTAINVLGLAAGMAVCLLVGLLFWDQVTHDDFHPGADRIQRITTMRQHSTQPFASSPAGLAPVLRDQVTGIDATTRIKQTDRNVSWENQGFRAQGLYAEPQFFDLFGFALEQGQASEALSAPFTAVLTQDLARRLYGDQNPVGKSFALADVGDFTVTGVIDRDAYRSHLPFDALYSFATLQQTRPEELRTNWTEAFSYYTYLRLAPGTSPSDLTPSLRSIADQYLPPASAEGTPPRAFRLQSLSALPLSERLPNEIATGMLPSTVAYFLAVLALVVLLAAAFNYVNLSTARSLTRGREVGVRKTVGAHRSQVMGQFIVEGMVVSVLALGLAVVLLQGLIPLYNQLAIHQELGAQIDVSQGPLLYAAFLGFALVVGGVSGLYPAWHLSKFQPARVLKASAQQDTPGFGWMTPRKVLTVLQFAGAVIVIVTATLVYQQTQHMSRLENVGLQTENVARISLQDAEAAPFLRSARTVPGVQQVGAARNLPLSGRTTSASIRSDRRAEPLPTLYYSFDYEALDVLRFSLTTSEDWSEARFESGQVVVVNEATVQALGFDTSTDALGALVTLERDTTREVRIAGTVPNFYFRVFEDADEPAVFHYNPSEFRIAIAGVSPEQSRAALDSLGATWRQFDATSPLDAGFYEDLVRTRFVAPLADAGGALGLVAALAVLIGCLSLLGIAAYTVQTRTREIGIRKALGATVSSVVRLLSADFLWLVGAAVAVGLPAAWWLNRLWLQNLAFRIELTALPFVASAAGLIGLALLAVGSQTIQAARTDPARTLRDE